MFAITSKVKIAAGIAAGALTLGAAGAYAANANNNIPTYSFTNSGKLQNGGQTLNLVSTKPGQTLQFPTTPFKNEGQCTSWFAKNKTLALAPTNGTTVKKSYHGNLLRSVQKFCATYAKTDATGDTTESDTTDTSEPAATETDTTDTSDSTGPQSGASHAHGHGHGHGASDLD